MGARHTEGVGVVPHDGPPGLGPLKDGDAGGQGGGVLGVALLDGAVRITRSQSPKLSALCPTATGMPRDRRCFTVPLSDMSEPWMISPLSWRTSARGHMETPPMPTRWGRVPGTKNSLMGF